MGKLRENYRFSTYAPPLHMHSFPHYQHSPNTVVHLLQLMNPYQHIIIAQSPQLTIQFTHGGIYSLGLEECIMSDIYPSLQYYTDYFHCPQILCFSQLSFLSLPQPLATKDLFTISLVLSFPEGHIGKIIHCVVFSDWLLSFSHMHLRFIHVLRPDSSLSFCVE